MPKFKDLTGMKFGKLTVIEQGENHRQPSGKSIVMWKCRCECGSESLISASNLTTGNSTKCKKCTNNLFTYKHGDSPKSGKKRLYRIWMAMKNRCLNRNVPYYVNYGGRGITICDEWLNYSTFREWALNNGYSDDLTIDRIDVNGNYEPTNCRWITLTDQQSNRRNCHYIEYKGQRKILKDWAKELNIPERRLSSRLRLGWNIEDAFTREYNSSFRRRKVGVAQIDCNSNEIINIYPSIKEASLAIGNKYPSGIKACLDGKQITSYGFKWKRLEEINDH